MKEYAVLFATDFEGDVKKGLRIATKLALDRSARLLMAHVVPLRREDGEGMLHDSAELTAGDAERALRELSPSDQGVPHSSFHLVGDPEHELARVVEEHGVELLVMEARPRSAMARLLGPGLIERLRDRVECPIVTYRPGESASEMDSEAGNTLSPMDALEITLVARVDALMDWLDGRAEAVAAIARRPWFRQSVTRLVDTSASLGDRTRAELSLHLREHLLATHALGVGVWVDTPREPGVAAIAPSPHECVLALGGTTHPGHAAWMPALMRDGCAVCVPPGNDEGGTVILAGAPVPLTKGRAAALVFAFDARDEFLRILAQPGPTPSAETYAFDEQGVMLSNTQFPGELRQHGLLPPAMQAVGHVRVCDPHAVDVATSHSTWPLTRMAASAVSGSDGRDTRGYRDYRGVPVVGVWRWVPKYRFGVAAEMDIADAVPTSDTVA